MYLFDGAELLLESNTVVMHGNDAGGISGAQEIAESGDSPLTVRYMGRMPHFRLEALLISLTC